ncbi:uncharacterized protein LOC112166547 [Rosa chinensis]|uniref:uncharacterized protein LOC112166547 n=1 Tax=Rosa chinensis TaxID=74649 RepID=UPI000D097448|nr:uncharacterized protein LOC112166547 [Rosa chinensis]
MTSQMNEISVHVERTEPEQVLDECCIYRVPSKLRNVNKASYTPQLLSIGPFHYGSPKLKDMESHKQKYYEKFLKHCSKDEAALKRFVNQHLDRILSCYAGTIECRGNIINVILVDACFIIEMFMTDSETENHHILRSPWMRKAVEKDLILFENQIPYFFLEELYDFAISSRDSIVEPEIAVHPEPVQHQFLTLAWVNSYRSKLAGLTTKELKLTRFWATYDAESVIRNIMALEQLIYPKKAYICSYFLLLSQLVNTVEDIDLLIKDGVVENLLGSNKSVEKLINSFCVHIVEEISCYSDIYDQLNEHYKTSLGNRRMATLKQVYFKDLWTGSATILGLVVLVFSIIATIKSLTYHKR